MEKLMKKINIKNIISVIGLTCFIVLAMGTTPAEDETNSSSSSSSNKSNASSAQICQLAGCSRSGDGWRYYTGSDLGAYSYSCFRLGPSTGHSYNYTYCTKNHCIQDQ